MKTVIIGAGNLLLADEGFGIHLLRCLEERYIFPPEVELTDVGTLGIMASHLIEGAKRVYVLDTVVDCGEPGELVRFELEDFMLSRLPLKMSPHQIGVQETLLLCEMRGSLPEQVSLIGAVPVSLDAGVELSPALAERLPAIADSLAEELRRAGHEMAPRH